MDLPSPSTLPFRPDCLAGVPQLPSTVLKWGADGELTDLDLHHVMVRLCQHDPQACGALAEDRGAPV